MSTLTHNVDAALDGYITAADAMANVIVATSAALREVKAMPIGADDPAFQQAIAVRRLQTGSRHMQAAPTTLTNIFRTSVEEAMREMRDGHD